MTVAACPTARVVQRKGIAARKFFTQCSLLRNDVIVSALLKRDLGCELNDTGRPGCFGSSRNQRCCIRCMDLEIAGDWIGRPSPRKHRRIDRRVILACNECTSSPFCIGPGRSSALLVIVYSTLFWPARGLIVQGRSSTRNCTSQKRGSTCEFSSLFSF